MHFENIMMNEYINDRQSGKYAAEEIRKDKVKVKRLKQTKNERDVLKQQLKVAAKTKGFAQYITK